jgi:hypothetical protein
LSCTAISEERGDGRLALRTLFDVEAKVVGDGSRVGADVVEDDDGEVQFGGYGVWLCGAETQRIEKVNQSEGGLRDEREGKDEEIALEVCLVKGDEEAEQPESDAGERCDGEDAVEHVGYRARVDESKGGVEDDCSGDGSAEDEVVVMEDELHCDEPGIGEKEEET